jgi:hypothetical protein
MTLYLVQYDSWNKNVSIFSTFEKAKEDIIDYVKNGNDWGWNLEDVQIAFEEVTAELFGFDTWEEGLRLCDYDRIDEFLGDFASIKKIIVDKSMWKP